MYLIALPQVRTLGIVTPKGMQCLLHKARRLEATLVLNMVSDIYNEKVLEYPECNLHVYSAVWTGVAQVEPLMHS